MDTEAPDGDGASPSSADGVGGGGSDSPPADPAPTASHDAGQASSQTVDSRSTVEAAEAGRERAEEVIRGIEELVEYRDEVEANVEMLVTGMEEIRDVASVIEDVADRTNILAMNAAIEAARAKEGGAGFGVVADEVKELAETTGERVDEIDETIDRMSEAGGGSVVALEELADRIEANEAAAREALDAIDGVADAAGRTTQAAGSRDDADDDGGTDPSSDRDAAGEGSGGDAVLDLDGD